jgi:hypothetical protein
LQTPLLMVEAATDVLLFGFGQGAKSSSEVIQGWYAPLIENAHRRRIRAIANAAADPVGATHVRGARRGCRQPILDRLGPDVSPAGAETERAGQAPNAPLHRAHPRLGE